MVEWKREARPHKEANVKGRDKQFPAASSERILNYVRTGGNSILFKTVPFTLTE